MENIYENERFLKNIFSNHKLIKSAEKQILSEISVNNSTFKIDEVNNSITTIIKINISVKASLFTVNFRENLINWLKKKYENRAYYIFYLNKINYEPILTQELPLIYTSGDLYTLTLPLDVELYYFLINEIVLARIILNTNNIENKIIVFATNEYITCRLNLTSDQILETKYRNQISFALLHDKKRHKIYKNNDQIHIKITNFFNNQLETNFTPRLNCEGTIED